MHPLNVLRLNWFFKKRAACWDTGQEKRIKRDDASVNKASRSCLALEPIWMKEYNSNISFSFLDFDFTCMTNNRLLHHCLKKKNGNDNRDAWIWSSETPVVRQDVCERWTTRGTTQSTGFAFAEGENISKAWMWRHWSKVRDWDRKFDVSEQVVIDK